MMRAPFVKIVSRIYVPEPGGASFRLASLARSFAKSGARVEVVTTMPPSGMSVVPDPLVIESRWPVLRNRQGAVRGYLQYLSFDIPMFLRIVFGSRADLLVVEPPPTTVFLATIAAHMRRTPMIVYAPDVWSDASQGTGVASFVVKVLRALERFGWNHSLGVVAVNEGVADRVRAIAPHAKVAVVGNGIDTVAFRPTGYRGGSGRFFAYTGTVSEWQGADLFIRALSDLLPRFPDLRLVFVGQGSSWESLRALAGELSAPVDFVDTVPPEDAAAWLRGAVASLSSIMPDQNYDFAFPTKIFASWACGVPVLYAGPGPARDVLDRNEMLGRGVDYDLHDVREAMASLLDVERSESASQEIAAWARGNVSLDGVSARVIAFARELLTAGADS